MKQTFFSALAAMLFAVASHAQVQFKMTYDQSSERYTVSVIPQASYVHPQNITGTGQVTIKAPANHFTPVDIQNHLEGMVWEANSRNNAPNEEPDFDYISFGLIIQGVAFPNYEDGVEMPLFSFQNAYGCTGKVVLVNNTEDPFMPPNSENANIGNTITILGAGGDAYAGIIGNGECDCNAVTASNEEVGLEGFKVYPNPATDFVNVEINWIGDAADATLSVVDASGKKIQSVELDVVGGSNVKKLNVESLIPGAYMLWMEGEDWKINLDRFTKQ